VKATVFFTFGEVDGHDLHDRTAVVIDVLRATSTMIAALAAGAEAIYPVVSVEDAIKLVTSLGRTAPRAPRAGPGTRAERGSAERGSAERGETLLAGERRGHPIEGFDLGNSPAEFTPEAVSGKRVVMSTTNGTAALVAASGAERVLVAAFVNLAAVAAAVEGAERLAVVCAGREGRFAIDDALCAGMLISRLADRLGGALELEDAGRAALALASSYAPDADFLLRSASGAALAAIGLEEDVRWCARADLLDLVPELSDRVIRSRHGA
jgi:2-phosphosulfolactate phosphatase